MPGDIWLRQKRVSKGDVPGFGRNSAGWEQYGIVCF